MIQMQFFKQNTPYSCGAAVMRMMLRFYGRTFSEEVLMQRLGTREVVGTYQQAMADLAIEEGFDVYVNKRGDLEEVEYFLRKNLPVIVYFIEPAADQDHYAIVVGSDEKGLILNDPTNGPGFRMTRKDFQSARHRSEHGMHKEWIMVMSAKSDTRG